MEEKEEEEEEEENITITALQLEVPLVPHPNAMRLDGEAHLAPPLVPVVFHEHFALALRGTVEAARAPW